MPVFSNDHSTRQTKRWSWIELQLQDRLTSCSMELGSWFFSVHSGTQASGRLRNTSQNCSHLRRRDMTSGSRTRADQLLATLSAKRALANRWISSGLQEPGRLQRALLEREGRAAEFHSVLQCHRNWTVDRPQLALQSCLSIRPTPAAEGRALVHDDGRHWNWGWKWI